MTKTRGLSAVVAILATGIVATPALAHGGKSRFNTTLSGYNETTATVNSPATGSFVAAVSKDESTIAYTLTYSGIPTTVTQAHIHFGRPGLTGGIALFLCSNLGNGPAGTQSCPPSGTVSGTLTAANIVGPAAQGIAVNATGFADMIKAIRNGSAYANVHSTQFPSGEIRGPLGDPQDDEDDDD